MCYEWILKGLEFFNWAVLISGVVIVWCGMFFPPWGKGPKSSGALDGILDFCSERWVSWIRLGYFLKMEGDVFHYCSGRTVL